MKLFQIEEPDGGPLDADGPGLSVGIDIAPRLGGAVALSVGGNPELLPGADGARRLVADDIFDADGRFVPMPLVEALLALRGRVEKQLSQPVTHAVIAADPLDEVQRDALAMTAEAAGLTILEIMPRQQAAALVGGAPADDAPALGAAVAAEELAPARP